MTGATSHNPIETGTSNRRRFTPDGYEHPTVSLYPSAAVARVLLEARGWKIRRYGDKDTPMVRNAIAGGFHSAESPSGARYWHLEEALQIALDLEATFLMAEDRQPSHELGRKYGRTDDAPMAASTRGALREAQARGTGRLLPGEEG